MFNLLQSYCICGYLSVLIQSLSLTSFFAIMLRLEDLSFHSSSVVHVSSS